MAAEVNEDSVNEGDDQKDKMSKCSVRVTESGVRIREFNKFEPLDVMETFKNICEPAILRQDSMKNSSRKAQNDEISLFTTVDNAFNDDDDDLFFGFDTEAFDEVFGSQSEKSSDYEKIPVQAEMRNDSCNSEIQCNSNRPACDFSDDFEDEFDKDLASLDETIIGAQMESQANRSGCERCVINSNNHDAEMNNEFKELEEPVAVPFESSENSSSRETALELPTDIRLGLCPHVSFQSQTVGDIFESSQPSEAPASVTFLNRDEDEFGNVEKNSDDDEDSKFYEEFDEELDLLC